jgi:hypothetical protein
MKYTLVMSSTSIHDNFKFYQRYGKISSSHGILPDFRCTGMVQAGLKIIAHFNCYIYIWIKRRRSHVKKR